MAPPPKITRLQNISGPESGGTPVLIFGSGFLEPNSQVADVTFGGNGSRFTVDADDLVTSVSPPVPASTGEVPIQVTSADGTTTAGDSPTRPTWPTSSSSAPTGARRGAGRRSR